MKVIDAKGGYVTPGGVDSHVHLDQGSLLGGAIGDRFETGTRSAIAGGTTTVISFAFQSKSDETILPIIEEYHKKVRSERQLSFVSANIRRQRIFPIAIMHST
jgi:dihydropyrimidinase